jgi:chromosome segregation ATPase
MAMQLRVVAALAGGLLFAAGCATQDQLRQTEADSAAQRQAMAALRADVRRAESVSTELRAAIERNDAAIRQLGVQHAETRARAENAEKVSREFLASLLAVREEQRRQLDENGVAFAEIRRRLNELDARLRQGSAAFEEANRRLVAAQASLAELGSTAAKLEAEARRQRESGDAQDSQIAGLRTQVEALRAALGSESFLRMMREIESARQDTASLRGAFEELQKGQADTATRFRNYYVDLDTRIRTMKQKIDEQMTRDLQGVGEHAAELRIRVDELKQSLAETEARGRGDREALKARIESINSRIEALDRRIEAVSSPAVPPPVAPSPPAAEEGPFDPFSRQDGG